MKRYTIKKTYQYTETVEVEAESETEAKNLADVMDGDRNYDDTLYSCEVIDEREI